VVYGSDTNCWRTRERDVTEPIESCDKANCSDIGKKNTYLYAKSNLAICGSYQYRAEVMRGAFHAEWTEVLSAGLECATGAWIRKIGARTSINTQPLILQVAVQQRADNIQGRIKEGPGCW
jgi:hypothetical protein